MARFKEETNPCPNSHVCLLFLPRCRYVLKHLAAILIIMHINSTSSTTLDQPWSLEWIATKGIFCTQNLNKTMHACHI